VSQSRVLIRNVARFDLYAFAETGAVIQRHHHALETHVVEGFENCTLTPTAIFDKVIAFDKVADKEGKHGCDATAVKDAEDIGDACAEYLCSQALTENTDKGLACHFCCVIVISEITSMEPTLSISMNGGKDVAVKEDTTKAFMASFKCPDTPVPTPDALPGEWLPIRFGEKMLYYNKQTNEVKDTRPTLNDDEMWEPAITEEDGGCTDGSWSEECESLYSDTAVTKPPASQSLYYKNDVAHNISPELQFVGRARSNAFLKKKNLQMLHQNFQIFPLFLMYQ